MSPTPMKETPSHTQRLLESLDDQTGGVRLHIHFRLAVPEFQGVALMPWQQRSSDSNSLSMWDFELISLGKDQKISEVTGAADNTRKLILVSSTAR